MTMVNRRSLFLAAIAWLTIAATSAEAAPVRIVALGASDTRGKGVSANEAYPAQLQAALRAQGIEATVTNAGINDDTTSDMLARIVAVPPGTRLVILQPGGNDAHHGIQPAQTGANLDAILSRLSARGTAALMFTYAGKVDSAAIASKYGAKFLGGFHVGVGASGHLPDGHMNAQGYAALVQKILAAVSAAVGSGR